MKLQLIFSVCLFNIYTECTWRSNNDFTEFDHPSRRLYGIRSQHWHKKWENESPTTAKEWAQQFNDPPDHTKVVAMSRYVLHNTIWCSIATISTLPGIKGFPFSNVKSFVDGSLVNSTGVPYFYMAPADFTAKDLSKNSRVTVLVSLQETGYCAKQQYDPQDPRCTRLMLSGKMKRVKPGTNDYIFAKTALFERHPDMANYPADHNWFVAKLKIVQIAMVDWFGGAKMIPVKDYLAYNYTGNEIYDYYYKKEPEIGREREEEENEISESYMTEVVP